MSWWRRTRHGVATARRCARRGLQRTLKRAHALFKTFVNQPVLLDTSNAVVLRPSRCARDFSFSSLPTVRWFWFGAAGAHVCEAGKAVRGHRLGRHCQGACMKALSVNVACYGVFALLPPLAAQQHISPSPAAMHFNIQPCHCRSRRRRTSTGHSRWMASQASSCTHRARTRRPSPMPATTAASRCGLTASLVEHIV
jgi:hypothetical protein